MRVLVIDNNIDLDSWGAADLRKLAASVPGATVHVRRAPQGDLPPDPLAYDRVILSGSKTSILENAPWIEKLQQLVARVVDAGKPFLGVCYGHQILARTLGGITHVGKSARPELGWTQIETKGECPLFNGLPAKFFTFAWHLDEVTQLPPGTVNLARSEFCEIQAFQLQGAPVFGIQFHPERSVADGEKSLRDRKKTESIKTLRRGQGEALFDAAVGDKIFRNFLSA